MLGQHTLILDTFCELADQLQPFADQEFWDFGSHQPVANSVTVISRQTLNRHAQTIRQLAESDFFLPVLVNPTEGSQTMKLQCQGLGLLNLMANKKFLTVGSGNMESQYANMWYDSYRYKPYDYQENLIACTQARAIFTKKNKPYQFLFLNGRTRPHRKYLIERLKDADLLTHSLWSNLDTSPVPPHLNVYGDLCNRPSAIQTLPKAYEYATYSTRVTENFDQAYVKNQLFDNTWGEIYLNAAAYIDTYFSLVSETVFDYPYSLMSEKIYKPIAIGHPFVAVTNTGFYRDLHNAGFRTFHHLIDEKFDHIDNNQDRLDRIVEIVQDLCQQDLDSFVVAAQEVCVYNQQHMHETAPKIKQEFVPRFREFLDRWHPT